MREFGLLSHPLLRSPYASIKERDPALLVHLKLTARIVKGCMLVNGIGLDRRLVLAALLHDIGKVFLPQQVLKKPGPLTREEWELVKLHPIIGAKLIWEVEALRPLAYWVLCHHERPDGRGYLGMKGLEKEVWILQAADAAAAMLEGRPYSPPKQPAEAAAELLKGAGSQFEPEAAALVIKVLKLLEEKPCLRSSDL